MRTKYDENKIFIVKSFKKQFAFAHMCLKDNNCKIPLMTIENDLSMKKLRLILLNKYWIEGLLFYHKLNTYYLHCKVCRIQFAITEENIHVV